MKLPVRRCSRQDRIVSLGLFRVFLLIAGRNAVKDTQRPFLALRGRKVNPRNVNCVCSNPPRRLLSSRSNWARGNAGPATDRDHDDDIERLDTIPGIGRTAAEIVIAETGGDMAPFATAGHLASWIGVCPGVNESAGVNKSGRTRHGNANLKRILGTAAMAAIKKKDSYYAAYYRRIAARLGNMRALVAVMHKLAIAIWHALHDKTATTTSVPTTSPAPTPNAPSEP